MRQIITKYEGSCGACGATLTIGSPAMYEKSLGIFCVGCEPKDPEQIRTLRLERAERKAARLEEWAGKRESRADAQLNSYPEIRHDWAFITQHGRIPLRERMNAADSRALESLEIAQGMRRKAESLRHVRVKGDAGRRRQAIRDKLDAIITKGSQVHDFCFGSGEVVQVNTKSYSIRFDSGSTYARDKSYVRPE
jgi:hypothetical protein